MVLRHLHVFVHLAFIFQVYVGALESNCHAEKNQQVSMTRKCHNHRPQTNLLHREEETQKTDSYDCKNTLKVRRPTLSSSAKLQNSKGLLTLQHKTRTKPQELEVRSLYHLYSLKTKSSRCHYE